MTKNDFDSSFFIGNLLIYIIKQEPALQHGFNASIDKSSLLSSDILREVQEIHQPKKMIN